jgi:beta-alanine degradation protein BauB
MSGVGTQKVFENDRVIVWHLDLEPGELGARHTHELDYVVRVLSGSTLEVFGPEGELLDTVELESGGAVSFRVDGDQILADRPGYPTVPATHSARNVGTNTFREVLIEFKNSGIRPRS